jgi:putative transposase
VFHEAKEIAGKIPETLITDGLHSYKEAFRKEFLTTTTPKSQHISAIKLSGKAHTANNNKMERINGEIRDREKTMRGLKKKDTAILKGMQVYHRAYPKTLSNPLLPPTLKLSFRHYIGFRIGS